MKPETKFMNELTRAVTMLETLTAKVTGMDSKVDDIIKRNAKADSAIAVLQTEIVNHGKEDDDRFNANDKKHTMYDKFIIGLLAFGILQLLAIVGYYITRQ